MGRVIQDSDDEDDFEGLEVEEYPPTVPLPNMAATHTATTTRTGSTETWHNAYQQAHLGLQTQVDTPKHPASRDVYSGSQRESQNPKPPSSSARTKSLASSPFIKELQAQKKAIRATCAIATPTDNIWNLQGTLRDNYTEHEPMAMFPDDASSTQPNGTQTQAQILAQLAEVAAPEFLGLEPQPFDLLAATAEQPRRASVPWSEFLRTQTVDGSQTQPGQSESIHGKESEPAPERPEMERLSQCSQLGSPEILQDAPPAPDIASEKPLTPPKSEKAASVITGSDKPSSRPSSTRREAQADPLSQSQRRKRRLSQPVASDDYLEDIALPKEQYKPRPSRSRSTNSALDDPIDYSVRPGKAAKRAARRSSTTSKVGKPYAPPSPQKLQQICDMDLSLSTTRAALESNGGDVNLSIEWLVNNAADKDADELAASPAAKAKRVKPNSSRRMVSPEGAQIPERPTSTLNDNLAMPCPADSGNIDTVPALASGFLGARTPEKARSSITRRTPAKVEVVIPRAKAPTSEVEEPQLKPRQEQATDVDPDVGTAHPEKQPPQLEQKSSQSSVPKPKKGRGRPKKATLSTETPDRPVQVLAKEVLPVVETGPRDVKGSPEESLITNTKEPSPPTPLAEPAPAATFQTPEKPLKPFANASSSARRGMSYRVGLSRRARIQPLLRVVKK